MGWVPAICTQCNAKIEVDSSKDAGICKYCGTAFVTEKVIKYYTTNYNTYNTNYIQADTITTGTESADKLYETGMKLVEAKRSPNARDFFEKIRDIYPSDYRGPWGTLLCDFNIHYHNCTESDIQNYINRYDYVCALVSADEKKQIDPTYKKYILDELNYIKEQRRREEEQRQREEEQRRREMEERRKAEEQQKIQIEQNRCAMACQGCGAVFLFFLKKAVDSSLKSIYC